MSYLPQKHFSHPAPLTSPGVLYLRNLTEATLPKFRAVPLNHLNGDGDGVSPARPLELRDLTFDTSDTKFGVTWDEISPNRYGRVLISGATPVKINGATPLDFARPKDGSTELEYADSGEMVLRSTPSEGRAVITLGGAICSSPSIYTGFFAIRDISEVDKETGEKVLKIRVCNGADPASESAGTTDIGQGVVSAVEYSFSESEAVYPVLGAIYRGDDEITHRPQYTVGIYRDIDALMEAAGDRGYGSFAIGSVIMNRGKLEITQEYQGGKAYFSMRYFV